MKMLEAASTQQLYAILVALECAHEPDQLDRAERQMTALGCTRAELEAEWDRREAINREAAKTIGHVQV